MIMGKLICCCKEAKTNCEKRCLKWLDKKNKPDKVYLIPS